MPDMTISLIGCTPAVPDHSKSVPFKFDREGRVISGKLHVDHVAPGTPFTIDAEEAERMLKRFGGAVHDPAPGVVIRTIRKDPGPDHATNADGSPRGSY